MHPTSRILALTAALAALSSAASAAEVRLNFNELGARADTAGAPIAVPDTDGLRFNGAYVYGQSLLGNIPGFDNLDFVSTTRGGILLNRQGGATTSNDISISLIQESTTRNAARSAAADPAVFFQHVTFNLFTKGANTLYGTDASGVESFIRSLTFGGQDSWTPSPLDVDLDDNKRFVSLRFSAVGAPFSLDDMIVTLSADPGTGGNGGNVPEPASYGLVGLALLAAGAASRRKQRG